MPVMDGFALCREWRSDPEFQNIPFIFYTATYTEAKDRDFALSLGADLFLVKPLEPHIFMQAIEEVLTKGETEEKSASAETQIDDDNFYREYNVRLVHKLEDKLKQLEAKNRQLKDKEQALSTANRELAQQNQLIQQREHELESILDNLLEGVFLLDNDLTIIDCNLAATDIFGYSKEELHSFNIKHLIPELESIENTIKKNQSSTNIIFHDKKFRGKHNNNKLIPIRLSLKNIPVPDQGKLVCSCLDITIQEKQEEQIQHRQKMDALGQLTSGIAHDFNNMLGVIMGFSELLKMKLNESSKEFNFIQEVLRASERAKKLVKKLLGFSKQSYLEPESININETILSQRSLLEKALTVSINLQLDLYPELCPVWLDPGCLEDAILNMSINAMHAMPEGGHLTISTQKVILKKNDAELLDVKAGDYAALSITDTGSGMSDEVREKIFDPFFSTKGESGTGLGMSQVYGFVQQSEGAIQIYSEPGKGTRIIIHIPCYKKQGDHKENEQRVKVITQRLWAESP